MHSFLSAVKELYRWRSIFGFCVILMTSQSFAALSSRQPYFCKDSSSASLDETQIYGVKDALGDVIGGISQPFALMLWPLAYGNPQSQCETVFSPTDFDVDCLRFNNSSCRKWNSERKDKGGLGLPHNFCLQNDIRFTQVLDISQASCGQCVFASDLKQLLDSSKVTQYLKDLISVMCGESSVNLWTFTLEHSLAGHNPKVAIAVIGTLFQATDSRVIPANGTLRKNSRRLKLVLQIMKEKFRQGKMQFFPHPVLESLDHAPYHFYVSAYAAQKMLGIVQDPVMKRAAYLFPVLLERAYEDADRFEPSYRNYLERPTDQNLNEFFKTIKSPTNLFASAWPSNPVKAARKAKRDLDQIFVTTVGASFGILGEAALQNVEADYARFLGTEMSSKSFIRDQMTKIP